MLLRRTGLAAAITLIGCGDNLEGSWEGQCAFEDLSYAYEADFEMEITDGRGALLLGTAELDMWDGQTFAGDLEGERNKDWVKFEAGFKNSASQDYSFEVRGEMDGQDIVGECRLTVPNGTGALVGEIELQR